MENALHELALFAGAGGGILGGKLLGWRTICAVETDPHAISVLAARQSDKTIPIFPIWSDVRTFDGVPWRGRVDVISAGFPCQDISSLGSRKGLAGEKSGLWFETFRIIREVRPPHILLENSPLLRSRGLDVVLSDLSCIGYNAAWGVFSAAEVGAPHIRKRMWIRAALPNNASKQQRRSRKAGISKAQERTGIQHNSAGENWWATEPALGRVADGLPHQLDRIRRLGNAQVPRVVVRAWTELGGHLESS